MPGRTGRVLAATGLLAPALVLTGAPAEAACSGTATADQLLVTAPLLPPFTPPGVASARAQQTGAGTDAGHGEANSTGAPILTLGSLSTGTTTADATATVAGSGATARGQTQVQRVDLTVGTLRVVVIAARTRADASSGPASAAASAEGLRINDTVVPFVPQTLTFPGAGTLEIAPRRVDGTTASVSLLRLTTPAATIEVGRSTASTSC